MLFSAIFVGLRKKYAVMNKVLTKLSLLVVLLVGVAATSAYAQSAAEIEMAKKLARQQGYSESEINAMMSKYNSGSSTTLNSNNGNYGVSDTLNRNNIQFQNGNNVRFQNKNDKMYRDDMMYRNDMQNSWNAADWELRGGNGLLTGRRRVPEIFGHSIFRNENVSFIPSYNIPTPSDYRLSAGDDVVIDVWGAVVTNMTLRISPEGTVRIPDLGPVNINGQTVAQAEANIKEYLSKIYSGIHDPVPNTFVKVSLGSIRSVTVNVLGDLKSPGTYTMPSLSTIASSLYMAQGPDSIGTVRNVKLFRNGKEISSFDLYKFLIAGQFDSNVKLEDNDVVSVAPYFAVVEVNGAVKRPMRYEIREGETLKDLFDFAGGFTGNAFVESVYVERVKNSDSKGGKLVGVASPLETYMVAEGEFNAFKLENGDKVTVRNNIEEFANRVYVEGAVWYPGHYSMGEGISTVKELIAAAGGLKPEAYLNRAHIIRLGENKEKQMVTMNLQKVLLGGETIKLKNSDTLKIYSTEDFAQKLDVDVRGEVNEPGLFEYRKGMTVGDAILMAGGVTEAATLEKVEVARRIISGKEKNLDTDTVALVLHYNLLKNPDGANSELFPNDIIYVRRSAMYKPQQNIVIEGEVKYPGGYVIEKNTVRLTDIVKSASGFTNDAYVKGAKLTRYLTEDEIRNLAIAKDMAKEQLTDSLEIAKLDQMEVGRSYTIAINLDLAVANPGSYHDVVLRSGDVISVPKINNTVKVSGSVFFPNYVTYKEGANYRYYLDMSGGYDKGAMKKRIYVIHMNGFVARRGSKEFKVTPGCEIVVPKRKVDERAKGETLAAILGIASSTASLSAMIVTIINNSK